MSEYNFDKIIDRKGSGAIKVDSLEERYGRDDLIPLWVADMDFESPSVISEAIRKRTQHEIYGYTKPSQGYYDSILGWVENHHGWKIKQEWMSFIPGIVKGIAFVIDCFTTTEHKVVIQQPVYHPFHIIPSLHHRAILNNSLILNTEQYDMDLEALKKDLDSTCKVLILCNPHNPAGRVWNKRELIELADICYENGTLVISDEIHADLVYENQGHKHVPFASVSEKAAQNSITFMAPSKTFNIAGIVSSFAIVPNETIRNKFYDYLKASELDEAHLFAYIATEAAYKGGAEWLKEVKEYIWDNICYVDTYLKTNIPQIKAIIPQASYLVWLDCRQLGLEQTDLVSLFVNEAHLALNDGSIFGKEGEGFMRMNVGTSRKVLEKALDNLNKTINKNN